MIRERKKRCVFVSRRESYDRLIALGAPSDKVKQLGYIYSFVREISTGYTYSYVPIQRMWSSDRACVTYAADAFSCGGHHRDVVRAYVGRAV